MGKAVHAGPKRKPAAQHVRSKSSSNKLKGKSVRGRVVLPNAMLRTKAQLAKLVLSRPEDRSQTHSADKSTKELNADLQAMVRYIGKSVPAFGKSGVLQLAVGKRDRKITGGLTPTHNWRSGWAEWRNAVFLWVNAVDGKFTNTFLKRGREVSWFVGGANPTEDSPVVRRLLQTISGDEEKSGLAAPSAVFLFVRKHAHEPYVNCGRVSCKSYDSKAKGFKFKWTLDDFPALVKRSDAFKRIFTKDPPMSPRARTVHRWA